MQGTKLDHQIVWSLVGSELQAHAHGRRIPETQVRNLIRRGDVRVLGLEITAAIRLYPLRPYLGVELLLDESQILLNIVAHIAHEYVKIAGEQENVLIGNRLAILDRSDYQIILNQLKLLDIEQSRGCTIEQILNLQLSDSGIQVFGQERLVAERMPPAIEAVSRPVMLQATLFPYQERGYEYLKLMRSIANGCILGDEMGLGKTMQAIALLCNELGASRYPNLVVSPATLCRNWVRELQKFAPSVTTLEHVGPLRSGSAATLREAPIVITSYETLISDVTLMNRVDWNCVVLDEAQAIKNPASRRAGIVKSLNRRFSLAITGTPIENHLEDLWSILEFAEPSVLGSIHDFRARFEDNEQDASELQKITRPLVLRRRQGDVESDLPELIQIPLPLVMSSRERMIYDEQLSEIHNGEIPALVGVQKLRMICALGNSESSSDVSSAKIERLAELLEELFWGNRKAIIFGSYQNQIDKIVDSLRQRFPNAMVEHIDGRVAVKDRLAVVDSYTNFEGPAVLVLNPRAAGVGLNITAATCVVHFNPEWNPAVTDQATKRAHRTGSKQSVTVYHFCFENSVEERIVERALSRRQLAAIGAPGSDEEPGMSDIAWLLADSKGISS